jgi:hypothetical protein
LAKAPLLCENVADDTKFGGKRTLAKRRVTADEERELLAAAARLNRARAAWDTALAERDELIASLADDGSRLSDIAEILGMSTKAIRDARDRAGRGA